MSIDEERPPLGPGDATPIACRACRALFVVSPEREARCPTCGEALLGSQARANARRSSSLNFEKQARAAAERCRARGTAGAVALALQFDAVGDKLARWVDAAPVAGERRAVLEELAELEQLEKR